VSTADAEEHTELQVLHAQAVADGREVADTLAALAARLAEAKNPRRWAARKVAAALPARPSWPILALTAGTLALVALAVTWQHRTSRGRGTAPSRRRLWRRATGSAQACRSTS
jgi:hypothetical protein